MEQRLQLRFAIREVGQHGHGEEPGGDTRRRQLGHGGQAEIGARSPGLDAAKQRRIRGGDRYIDDELARRRDLSEKLEVSRHGGRLGRDAHAEPWHSPDGLEHAPRDTEAPFRRLIGIRGRADGHFLTALPCLAQPGHEPAVIGPLDVDALLELLRIRMTQIAVGGASVAIPAAELAAPIGIDRPSERHSGIRQAVHQLGAVKASKLGASPLIDDRADALDEARRGHSWLDHGTPHMLSIPCTEKAPRICPRGLSATYLYI